MNGVIDKYPGLKVALTEVDASWVPHFMSLLDSLVDLNQMYNTSGILENWNFGTPVRDIVLRKKPSQRIRENFSFAITNATNIELDIMLPVLVNKMGMAKNLMIESDYDHPEGTLDVVRRVRTLKEIDEESKDLNLWKECSESPQDRMGALRVRMGLATLESDAYRNRRSAARKSQNNFDSEVV